MSIVAYANDPTAPCVELVPELWPAIAALILAHPRYADYQAARGNYLLAPCGSKSERRHSQRLADRAEAISLEIVADPVIAAALADAISKNCDIWATRRAKPGGTKCDDQPFTKGNPNDDFSW